METDVKYLHLSDANFNELILRSDKPAVVDFWAEWCGPCKMLGPVIEELAADYEGQAIVGKLDVDNNPLITSTYGVRSLPTLLFIKHGQVVDKIVGAVPKRMIEERLKNLV